MLMPSVGSSCAAATFFPKNFYLCKLTFCGFSFETLAEALQEGWSGMEASRRFWEQLAGPYRAGRLVFQNGNRLRPGLSRFGPPFRGGRCHQGGSAAEVPVPAAEPGVGATAAHPRSMVAHDMKSSLALIGGFIQRLSGTEVDPERRRRYLETIKKEGEKLSALLDDFLACPEKAGERRPEIRPLPLARELGDTCEAHHLRAEKQGVVLTLECPPQLALPGEAKGLQRAFANLLDNALKYSPTGGTVQVRVREEAQEVRISVADEGPGIALGDLPHLFEAYYRGQGQDKIVGFGLGLATVRAVAATHGGRVEVRNRMDKGAEFTMVLPRHGPGSDRSLEVSGRENCGSDGSAS